LELTLVVCHIDWTWIQEIDRWSGRYAIVHGAFDEPTLRSTTTTDDAAAPGWLLPAGGHR